MDVSGDEVEAVFDGEVSGLEAMQLRMRQVAQVRLTALGRKENGPLSPENQRVRLPRAQELLPRWIQRDTTRHVNVRVIAATNRELRAEVDAGRFRLDLFYRLGVFPIHVPALRDRRADIAALTTQFIRSAGQRLNRGVPKVPQREMAKLLAYDWPGNIRELQHVVERAVILAPGGGAVQFDLTPSAEHADRDTPDRPFRTESEWRRLERENLLAALKACGGKVAGPQGAAALLGLNPHTLTSRLRAFGLKKTFGLSAQR